MSESNKHCDKAVKEKEAKTRETEGRIKDLMSVLDRYKKEKEELVQQKTEEVVKIKTDLEKKTNTVQVRMIFTLHIFPFLLFPFQQPQGQDRFGSVCSALQEKYNKELDIAKREIEEMREELQKQLAEKANDFPYSCYEFQAHTYTWIGLRGAEKFVKRSC